MFNISTHIGHVQPWKYRPDPTGLPPFTGLKFAPHLLAMCDQGICMTYPIYLIYLVYLVYLVYLIYLIYLICLICLICLIYLICLICPNTSL